MAENVKRTKVEKWGGIEVSRLGFGCMRLPTKDGKIDRELAAEMVDYAYNHGVNYFDTAYGYHSGESERFIGEALKRYPRDSYYLATKLPFWLCNTEEDVDAKFNEQLEKTQKDYFDFYMLHSVSGSRWPIAKRLKIVEKLMQKKKEGKIKRLGFSYHGEIDSFREIVDAFDWDFVQIQINYIDYVMNGAKDFYDKLCEKNIPCLVMEPVRGGFLANLPDAAAAEMKALDGGAVTAPGWALRWCIDMDNMPVILSGMSNMEQVVENVDTFTAAGKLTAEQADMIGRVRDIVLEIKSVPCTGCEYCMPCPFGVSIPNIFSIYNEYQLFPKAFRAYSDYQDLVDQGHGADLCTACGACVSLCPQSIQIPEEMAKLHDYLLGLKPDRA